MTTHTDKPLMLIFNTFGNSGKNLLPKTWAWYQFPWRVMERHVQGHKKTRLYQFLSTTWSYRGNRFYITNTNSKMTTKNAAVKSTQRLLPALFISVLQITVAYRDTELTSQDPTWKSVTSLSRLLWHPHMLPDFQKTKLKIQCLKLALIALHNV